MLGWSRPLSPGPEPRREVLKGGLGAAAITTLFGSTALLARAGRARAATTGYAFRELRAGIDERHHVADGYDAEVLIR
jgi:secreted PhoX family phosphatase